MATTIIDINGDKELWGFYHSESNYYNIISLDAADERLGGQTPILLGHFYSEKPGEISNDIIYGWRDADGKVQFSTSNGTPYQLEGYSLKIDIFSRNTGILESDIMLKKGAMIIGCGSVGSLVALELARAGVVDSS